MKDHKSNGLTKVLFGIYLLALFEIIVFKLEIPFANTGYWRSVNLIPFGQSLIVNGGVDVSEILMNMVIFVPLGIYLEMLWRKVSTYQKVLAILLVSATCEIVQYVFAVGASDVTDVINNTVGGAVGLLFYNMLSGIYQNDGKLQRHMNILAAVGTAVMGMILIILVGTNL